MSEKKVCKKCGVEKPYSDYYKCASMKDGYFSKCKDCYKKDVRENRSKKITHYREYDRKRAMTPGRVSAREEYAKTDVGRTVAEKAKSEWRKRNRRKANAHAAVERAIKSGQLQKMPCEVCGSSVSVHAHHEDYSKPLCVIWLCPAHHSWIHK